MVLEKLGSSLKDALVKITKAVFVDEKLVNELIKDIQRALLQADVNVKLVFELSKKIKERILKEETPSGLTKKEFLVHVVYDELTLFLGGEGAKIAVDKKPYVIMLAGLFGSGKTTTCGKLAKFFTKRGHKVALVGLDVYRPAAMDQLEQVATGAHVPVYIHKQLKDPVKIWKLNEKEYAKYDVIIVDTSGRDALSEQLIDELNTLNELIKPSERLLVIGADLGQSAEKQAAAFHEACHISGVIITRMDGTAKGGGALTACMVTEAPVKFIGVGEKIDDLEEFKPKNFIGRLLGLGDIEALLEKAKEAITHEEAQYLGQKFLSGKFNLVDLYQQMEAMSKMGPLGKLMEMIPGMGNLQLPKDLISVQEGKLKKWKYMMDSMTKSELEDPELIDGSRMERIAKGSGTTQTDVRELLKQYKQSKKVIKMLGGSPQNMAQMMKKFKGMPGIGM